MLSEIRLTTSKKVLGYYDTSMIKDYNIESNLRELGLIFCNQVKFVKGYIKNNTFYAATKKGTTIYFHI